MGERTLVIGNKNYSSWSLRPWLAMRMARIDFDEINVPMFTPEGDALIALHSPSGKVPVLKDNGLFIWDSLAICEYLSECFPDRGLWPEDVALRAKARSVTAEMHAGFGALREQMTQNCRGRFPGLGRTPAVLKDIARIEAIWNTCRAEAKGGPFLFGPFCIADAFYAPVVLRFVTYQVALSPVSAAYAEAIEALAPLREWLDASAAEPQVIERYENRAP